MAGRRGHATLDYSGLFVKSRIRYDFRYFRVGGGVCPRDKQIVTAVSDGPRNEGNLLGGLALTKDNLWKPLADCAVMIDAGEAEIFERVADSGQPARAAFRICGIETPLTDGVEERPQGIDGANGLRRLLLHSLTFDSAKTSSLEWRVVPRRSSLIL
jgi:hypothetical protein